MARYDPDRPQLPWAEPQEGVGTAALFLLLVVLAVAVGASVFIGIGAFLPD